MKTRKTDITPEEIIKKLKWFHGEDFSKYPVDKASFIENKRKSA